MISELIQSSFTEAFGRGKDLSNSDRSKLWVECLAQSFRNIAWQNNVTVFSKDYCGNRTEFRLNELLFDITVAEIETIKSVRGADITSITGAKWLVESEFKRTDSRDIIIDFSKLNIGNSENKLLVISAGSSLTTWALETIPNLIQNSSSIFFLAFLPQFTSPSFGPLFPQFLVLGGLFVVSTLLVFGGFSFIAGWLGAQLRTSKRPERILNRVAGTVFLGLAIKLVLTER